MYFAYGSNMDTSQMAARCPSARVRGIARLPEHRIVFSRFSQSRGCGVASVDPAAGHDVWGVLYKITEDDVSSLDSAEGYRPERPTERNAYIRTTVEVFVVEDQPETLIQAQTYIANPQPTPLRPNAAYMQQLINGARTHGLPQTYINELSRIEVAG